MKILLPVSLAVCASTFLGCMLGILVRRIPHRFHDIVMGFAAGVMLTAAMAGLLLPAFSAPHGLFMALPGTILGGFLVSGLDRIVPHLHRLAGVEQEEHSHNQGVGKVLLFVSAIALHKIPEGLATGVSFGTGELGEVLTVAGSICLQNIPEAVVMVAPLFAIGVATRRILGIALGIGLASMACVFGGYALVSLFSAIAPLLLGIAGGAMLYVISDEMIPETHAHGYEKEATFALMGGTLLVLALQSLLAA